MPDVISQLDRIIKRSLRLLAQDPHLRRWCAKENDWVNYFAHRYLIGQRSQRGPLRDVGQICIEVSVPQPRGYQKPSVRRDLVIWSECGATAFDGDCFDRSWDPSNHPIAILEWTVDRPGHCKSSVKVERERQWLRDYCQWQTSVLGYAIHVDGTCRPRTLCCSRFLGQTEDNKWLKLTLDID